MNIEEMAVGEFCELLASKEPTPGGGGAAALAGALAAGLCSMVGNYTSGKKAYVSRENDIVRLIGDSQAASTRLVELVQEDADEYSKVTRAYGLSKDDPNRPAAIQEALMAAMQPPLDMVREIADVIELLEEMCERGSRMLVSDVGCGAAIAHGALYAAAMNVYVNTKYLDDRTYADEIVSEVSEITDEYIPKCEAVVRTVIDRIR